MAVLTPGRRRADSIEGDLPEDIRPGDYWKILAATGLPKPSTYASNLTRTCWYLAVPLGRGDEAYSIANLMAHTVREHDDGTISVLPGDGSSNSILVTRHDQTWHGYVRAGVLEGD
jgi:chemotaxis methyl-accepting protein methylase